MGLFHFAVASLRTRATIVAKKFKSSRIHKKIPPERVVLFWWRHRDCFALLHSLAKSSFVKTSDDRRYSAFLLRVEPFTSGSNLRIIKIKKHTIKVCFLILVETQGFEPWTHWLKVSCSTNWAMSPELFFIKFDAYFGILKKENQAKNSLLSIFSGDWLQKHQKVWIQTLYRLLNWKTKC